MLSVFSFMSVPFPFGVVVVRDNHSTGAGTGTHTTLAGRGLPDVCYLLRSAPALCWPGIFLPFDLITAGTDVQKDRVETTVVAWVGCAHGRWS